MATTTKVVVVPYDPAWPAQFADIRASLAAALAAAGAAYLSIEHVGSTSVPGLWAKPQLDIDVVVADDGRGVVFADGRTAASHDDGGGPVTADAAGAARPAGAGRAAPSALGAAVAALEAAGYEHRGELGVPRRHRLRAPPARGPARNVYVVAAGSVALRNHVGVRDALRADAALRDEYAAVKRALVARAGEAGLGIGEYVEGKTEVVQRILERAGMGEEERAAVLEVNRSMSQRLRERADGVE
jgi:GrpB-like predicted nucleotidyltransferase (UPF0157 family)